jgi:hypothetical protein
MNELWIYQVLDIIGTLIESFGMYIIVRAFCPNVKKRLVNIIPPLVCLATTFIFTWFIDLPYIKGIAILVASFIAYKIVFKEKSIRIIAGILIQQICVRTAESLDMIIMSNIFESLSTIVDGTQVMLPQVFLGYFLLQIVMIAIFRQILKKHNEGIDNKSLIAISIFFIILYVLSSMSVVPFASGDTSWLNINLEVFMFIIGLLFAIALIYIKNYIYLKEKEQKDQFMIETLKRQYSYYQDKQKDDERIKTIYHDMKNHLLVLENKENTEETQEMAKKLREQIESYEEYTHTGNDFLDVIIKDKTRIAKEKNIDLTSIIDFNNIEFIEPLDISTIFGNAIDNAIEGVEKLSEEKRTILIKAGKINDFLSIVVENNYDPEIKLENKKTTKKDTFLHGYGIQNIKNAVEKYNGTCTITKENEKFILKILIPIK